MASRGGYALLAVLLVLMSLLFLAAPFLGTVRNSDLASRRAADRTEASLALDSAARYGRSKLGGSHAAADLTPFFDSEDELRVRNELPGEFLGASGEGRAVESTGARWDLEIEDLAGRIDLDSAPPHVIANLMDLSTRLSVPLSATTKSIETTGAASFPDSGVIWIAGELVHFDQRGNGAFEELQRGLGAALDEEDVARPGPLGPRNAAAGAIVMGQRAWALANWRLANLDGAHPGRLEPRTLDSLDRLADVSEFVLDGAWDKDVLRSLVSAGGVWGNYGTGPKWQHPVRLIRHIEPEEHDSITVDNARWFNAGSTIRISGNGVSELALVRSVSPQSGKINLDRALMVEQFSYGAVVEVLARRPVNINTASPSVLNALFANLQLLGRNSRITTSEAKQLVEVVMLSRPFTGFEDFVARLILPAAGFKALPQDAPVVPEAFASQLGESTAGIIDEDDALALYRNALNANDAELGYATMPFSFTSRDVYHFDLRTSVTAQSGVQRIERAREEVQQIAPSGELLKLWSSQADFDEELRLSRDAGNWTSGPEPTGRYDQYLASTPPPRMQANLGRFAFKANKNGIRPPVEGAFAGRDPDQGFARPWPYRVEEAGSFSGRIEHFDWESAGTGDADGRDLAVAPVNYPTDDAKLQWTGTEELLRPIHFSAWIKPRSGGDGFYLDLAGGSREVDRVSLLVEDQDLILRVIDGAGNHPETMFEEVAEVRYPLDEGPGLPADVWTHVLIDVRGNRPDQMTMLVDGRAAPETPGLTRLTNSITEGSSTIQVESTEGFPDPCVLMIGQELVEARVISETSFLAEHVTTGEYAGFGGRQARERFQSSSGELPMINQGIGKDVSHSVGTPVQLYGYSLPLSKDASVAESELESDLGAFAVARAISAVGGQSAVGDTVFFLPPGAPTSLTLGTGLGDDSEVTSIVLGAADPGRDVSEVMNAFSREGGFAAILQLGGQNSSVTFGATQDEASKTPAETLLFRVEIVHYSGWSGEELAIDYRGDACKPFFPDLIDGTSDHYLERHAFVFEWFPNWIVADTGEPIYNMLDWQTFVVPISVSTSNLPGGEFKRPEKGISEFAQLTRTGAETEFTEWIRYDEVALNSLVRSDGPFLELLAEVVRGGSGGRGFDIPTPPAGGGTGGQGPPAANLIPAPVVPAVPSLAPSLAPSAAASYLGAYWENTLGVPDPTKKDYFVSNAVQSQFQFRGVFGTQSNDHPAGTKILPVHRMNDGGHDRGWPGRFDKSFLMDYETSNPGFPVTVHRAYRPGEFARTSWVRAPDAIQNPLEAILGTGPLPSHVPELGIPLNQIFVALTAAAPIPFLAGVQDPVPNQTYYDVRLQSRLTLFPSGERPRTVGLATLGGETTAENVPDAMLDEAAFFSSSFGSSGGDGEPAYGAALLLIEELNSGSTTLTVATSAFHLADGIRPVPVLVLDGLNNDAGLLQIGNEILCYSDFDSETGIINIATGGRGLLGTREQDHAIGEAVSYLDAIPVTLLGASVSSEDSNLTILERDGFGDRGLVLIEDELVHYTRILRNALSMPSSSESPGQRDGDGFGLFRGRFGTSASSHTQGIPVISFPFRYWDLWAEGANAPEMAYFGFSTQQEDAYWKSIFWKSEGELENAEMGCLVRSDPTIPWDADPLQTKGLWLFENGNQDTDGNPLNVQSDYLEARVFVRYLPGAFDPIEGLSHGWKRAPRLDLLGTAFLAPSTVIERKWK